MADATPSTDLQRQFWDDWNRANRSGQLDLLMQRQRDMAVEWVRQCAQPVSILEVGCGTGWLSGELSAFGQVTGVDLSPQSIALAREKYPQVRFESGDFDSMALEGPFGFITSADVIAHVPSHAKFIDRVASLLAPGGLFVLMTQNPFVWNRSSELRPKHEGQLRNWPSLAVLKSLLRRDFRIRHVTSIFPGGDRGVLKLVNSRWVAGPLRKAFGKAFQFSLYERLLVGRELVIVAQRR